MGTAIIVFHDKANNSDPMPVARMPGSVSEVKTTNAASSVQSTTAAAGSGFVTVYAVGANQWVTSGSNPTAAKPATDGAVGSGFAVMSGQYMTFSVSKGHKIACREFA